MEFNLPSDIEKLRIKTRDFVNKHIIPLETVPSSYDNHQDHQVIYQECFRAFKKTSILGYEMPWNNRTFSTDVFVKLTKENLDEKFKMLDCYKTQGERVFMNKDYIFDVARTRGLQIDVDYAECYEAIRVVI